MLIVVVQSRLEVNQKYDVLIAAQVYLSWLKNVFLDKAKKFPLCCSPQEASKLRLSQEIFA